jgi:hypothetical protein
MQIIDEQESKMMQIDVDGMLKMMHYLLRR